MAAVYGREVAREIITALGLQDLHVSELHLHFPVDGAVTVQVACYPDEFHVRNAVKVIQRYNLQVMKDDDTD